MQSSSRQGKPAAGSPNALVRHVDSFNRYQQLTEVASQPSPSNPQTSLFSAYEQRVCDIELAPAPPQQLQLQTSTSHSYSLLEQNAFEVPPPVEKQLAGASLSSQRPPPSVGDNPSFRTAPTIVQDSEDSVSDTDEDTEEDDWSCVSVLRTPSPKHATRLPPSPSTSSTASIQSPALTRGSLSPSAVDSKQDCTSSSMPSSPFDVLGHAYNRAADSMRTLSAPSRLQHFMCYTSLGNCSSGRRGSRGRHGSQLRKRVPSVKGAQSTVLGSSQSSSPAVSPRCPSPSSSVKMSSVCSASCNCASSSASPSTLAVDSTTHTQELGTDTGTDHVERKATTTGAADELAQALKLLLPAPAHSLSSLSFVGQGSFGDVYAFSDTRLVGGTMALAVKVTADSVDEDNIRVLQQRVPSGDSSSNGSSSHDDEPPDVGVGAHSTVGLHSGRESVHSTLPVFLKTHASFSGDSLARLQRTVRESLAKVKALAQADVALRNFFFFLQHIHFGSAQGKHLLVMPLVYPLEHTPAPPPPMGHLVKHVRMRDGKLSPREIVNDLRFLLLWIRQQGFVHFDVHPGNVMLCQQPLVGLDCRGSRSETRFEPTLPHSGVLIDFGLLTEIDCSPRHLNKRLCPAHVFRTGRVCANCDVKGFYLSACHFLALSADASVLKRLDRCEVTLEDLRNMTC